jgi:hypothetical protein
MDAAVAELMGWTMVREFDGPRTVLCKGHWWQPEPETEGFPGAVFIGKSSPFEQAPMFRPSTNDADALRVLDALKGDGWHWRLDHMPGILDEDYGCSLVGEFPVRRLAAEAPTVALAICRAALMTGKEAENESNNDT